MMKIIWNGIEDEILYLANINGVHTDIVYPFKEAHWTKSFAFLEDNLMYSDWFVIYTKTKKAYFKNTMTPVYVPFRISTQPKYRTELLEKLHNMYIEDN